MDNKNNVPEFINFDIMEEEIEGLPKTYNIDNLCLSRGVAIKRLQMDNKKLKEEFNKVVVDLESSRRTFEAVTGELKKQLDLAKQRESEVIGEMLSLRLENEKLHILLGSKENLVGKLKNELLNVKRALKLAIKDLCAVTRVSEYFVADPEEGPQSARGCARDPRNPKVRFADSMDNNSMSPQNRQDI